VSDHTGLTIREVAARTGIPAVALRMWENRYGFPEPTRLASGHRRYCEDDIERIERVVRERDGGMSLPAAVERAQRDSAPADTSVYAGLRRRHAELIPYVLPKRTLAAMSHAMEDECCARAERALVFGSFQRERFYRSAEQRWRELARTAQLAFVFADFEERGDPDGGPIELPVAASDPFNREWTLVCDAPRYSVCLSASERPGQDDVPDSTRLFEAIWTVEVDAVRDAARMSADVAGRVAPDVAASVATHLEETPPAGEPVRLATALTNRMVAYVSAAG
jgi:DICT domain-containing protein